MKTAPLRPNEEERSRLIRNLEMLDVAPADFFDEITRAVALICDARVVMVCLDESCRKWFRVREEAQRERGFCERRLPCGSFMLVPDTREDARLRDDPAVVSDPAVRFYAAVPLEFSAGVALGALCVMDDRPHELDARQVELLKLLAGHVVTLIKLRLGKLEERRDFGEMALSKQRLQYQKDLLEAVLDNQPESVHILSQDGSIEQINHAGAEMLEASFPEELRQRKMGDFVLPEFRDAFFAMLVEVFRGRPCIAEYRIAGLSGAQRWMESHAAPLRNQLGEVVSLVAIARDVTRLKESQQQLMLAARVFTEAQEGIIITDARGNIVDVNPAFCRISGYSREEVIGKNPRLLQSGRQGPDFYDELWRTLAREGRWKGEMWNRKKNGELYAELISINALCDAEGQVVNYVGLFLDITGIRHQPG